ncbi:MAG: eL32 family ribosomal protein [archaeon]
MAGKKTEEKKAVAKKAEPKKDASVKGEEKKEAKEPKKKKEKKSRKVAVKKSKEVLALRRKVLSKSGLPIFRGSFGQRIIRKKSIAKWDKWRVRRGIDVKNEIQDGKRPGQGYRRPRELRHVHPSGFREFVVRTLNDVNAVPRDHAIRIKAGVGKKKRIVIVDKAIEKGIKVLNP